MSNDVIIHYQGISNFDCIDPTEENIKMIIYDLTKIIMQNFMARDLSDGKRAQKHSLNKHKDRYRLDNFELEKILETKKEEQAADYKTSKEYNYINEYFKPTALNLNTVYYSDRTSVYVQNSSVQTYNSFETRTIPEFIATIPQFEIVGNDIILKNGFLIIDFRVFKPGFIFRFDGTLTERIKEECPFYSKLIFSKEEVVSLNTKRDYELFFDSKNVLYMCQTINKFLRDNTGGVNK